MRAVPVLLSRAAVFAGAALASPACWNTATPTTVPNQHEVVPVARASIAGTVVGRSSGAPLRLVRVKLTGPLRPDQAWLSQPTRETQTDASGHFSFPDLAAGDYVISTAIPNLRGTEDRATLAEGGHASVTVMVYEGDPANMAAPYGAPPARRRVV
jgi:hypothetical protein